MNADCKIIRRDKRRHRESRKIVDSRKTELCV